MTTLAQEQLLQMSPLSVASMFAETITASEKTVYPLLMKIKILGIWRWFFPGDVVDQSGTFSNSEWI